MEIRPLTAKDLKAAMMAGCNFADFFGSLAWVLKNPRPVAPVPVKGKLHLFKVPYDFIH